ncbi:MAG: CarD family transcriptional regulator [Pseudomonadota bacterium]
MSSKAKVKAAATKAAPAAKKAPKPASAKPRAAAAAKKATASVKTKAAAPKARSAAKPATKKAAVKTTAKAASAPAKKTPVKKVAATPKKVTAPTAKKAPAKKTAASKATPKTTKEKIAAAVKKVAEQVKPAKKGRISVGAPVVPGMKKTAGAVRHAAAAVKPAAARKTAPVAPAVDRKPVNQRHGFKLHEHVVYPAHGVGQIVGIEEQEIAGMALELFVITFEKDKMTLRVPTSKLESVGMRKLAEDDLLAKAMKTLTGRARIKRTMWSRRAQEYEAKINSGDLISIAEVVRDLYRSENQPEQSYSERQLYEQALDRMARELAAVEKLDERGSVQRIVEILAKSAKGRSAAEAAAAEAEGDDGAAKAA